MLKILGFDNWTGGAHHFERLVLVFSARGMALSLVHLGSWGNDPNRPDREQVGQLSIRDIRSYPSEDLDQLLENEKPAAVLFFSTDTFAHRALNRYCRARGIPTVHLYHGLVRVQAIDRGSMYKVNFFAQLRFAGSRVIKAMRHVWPAYMGALWRTDASGREWLRFASDIWALARGRYIKRSADDARTSKCGVYTGADIEHALNKYGFAPGNVVAVGNPDLIHFGLPASSIGSHLHKDASDLRDVMYIDTGLVYTGWVFTSEAEFVQHLVDTHESLKKQGRHLLFKPHPDHRRSKVLTTVAGLGIEICVNADLVPRLRTSCACIVEPSSLSLVPALIGMPLLLANYGKLADCPFGEVLRTYPRSVMLDDVSHFNALIGSGRAYDRAATQAWIDENAGPLPAEDMPSRVADIFSSVIAEQALAPRTGGGRHGQNREAGIATS